MLKQLQNVVIGIGILAYAFLGFSPFASASHEMMDMHAADSAMSQQHSAALHSLAMTHSTTVQAVAHAGHGHTAHAAHTSDATHATQSTDCADTCIDSTAAASMDCLEHCLAQAAETEAPLAAIVLISLVVAAAVTITVQLFSFVALQIRKDRYIWRFRPLYIFNTVRLLE